MNQFRRLLTERQSILLLAAGLLLLPALLTHLGLLALYGDEGIRALVALEMGISGSYVTPTMFGEFYYNKPPLYNWILLAVFRLTGRSDEFIVRLPTVVFLLAYVSTVFFILKKHLTRPPTANCRLPTVELLPALALLTCGRVLFYDSMLGLIDTCFSWVIYGMFMVIYVQGEKEKWTRLFAGAYLLGAIGFMLKGLPAVLFIGIALATYFFWAKKWRMLLSVAHLAGMAVFGAVVGSYYAFYAQENGLSEVFGTLFNESAKRTFAEHGFLKTVVHLFTFPFEMCYHFLPWTLLAIYLFRKNALQLILKNRFVTWNALVFLTTILPYWFSVEVYPRYLLMHVPLAFTVLFFLHEKNKEAGSPMVRWVEGIFQGLCWVALVACLAPLAIIPLAPELLAPVPMCYPKLAFLTASIALLIWLYRRWEAQRLLVFVVVLLVVRIGFNWFIVPNRLGIDFNNMVRQTTLDAIRKSGCSDYYIFRNCLAFQPVTGYYFTRETGKILRNQDHPIDDPNACYLMNTQRDTVPHETLAKIRLVWERGELAVVKMKL